MEQPSTANRQKRVHRSLENFDEYNINPPLLTSPRSLEACRQHGIEAEELVYRYEDSFFEKNITEDIQEIRYRHYEKKRLEKLAIVRDERQRWRVHLRIPCAGRLVKRTVTLLCGAAPCKLGMGPDSTKFQQRPRRKIRGSAFPFHLPPCTTVNTGSLTEYGWAAELNLR
eukprot:3165627-Rhodomonas_salina.2